MRVAARAEVLDLGHLLAGSSRTFALTIPLLPEPTRRQVTVSYLLFRVADTLEDSPAWSPEMRAAALGSFADLLRNPSELRARRLARRWLAAEPCRHPGYLELLAAFPEVLRELAGLSPQACEIVVPHAIASAEGMRGFMEKCDADGRLRLADWEELRCYCYTVAGIVGELLTDLFLLGHESLAPIGGTLRGNARAFGEGLQLVNILRDAGRDASEGRMYLPAGVERARVFALARRDLRLAAEYVLALQAAGAARGLVAFTALTVRLALATLDAVQRLGVGAKVSRARVGEHLRELEDALNAGRPALLPRS